MDIYIKKLEKTAEEIGNQNWENRLKLAKARYLIKMASKTIDREKAFVVYCEGLKVLSSVI